MLPQTLVGPFGSTEIRKTAQKVPHNSATTYN